jgi:hypothetical protein
MVLHGEKIMYVVVGFTLFVMAASVAIAEVANGLKTYDQDD